MGEAVEHLRVLLVDDDETLAGGLAFALSQAGIEVAVAHRGKPVPGMITALRPDAIVLDISLPDLNGITVARLIRAQWPRLPIVFITGHDNSAEVHRALSLSCTSIVQKPFPADSLVTAIRVAVA